MNKENDVWKENTIVIFQESRLENSRGRNGRKKTNYLYIYLNEQHHRIKRTNLRRSEINLGKNQGSPKEH